MYGYVRYIKHLGDIDGIHVTPYLAAPWIRHGLWKLWQVAIRMDLPACESHLENSGIAIW